LADAAGSWERALELLERRGDRPGRDQTLRNLAVTFLTMGQAHFARAEHAESIAAFQRALGVCETLGDEDGIVTALSHLSDLHRQSGQFAQALEASERLHAALGKAGRRNEAATVLGNIGALHEELGRPDRARDVLERTLVEMEELGDAAGAARALGNLANAFEGLGESARALALHERALAAKEALGDLAGVYDTLGNIGVAYKNMGDHAKALAHYERALTGQEAAGDRSGAALTLSNIAMLHQSMGDYARALQAIERALELHGPAVNLQIQATLFNNLGIVHHSLGNYAAAFAAFERALAAQAESGDSSGAANTLGNIGVVHHDTGEIEKATATYERALAIKEGIGDHKGAAQTRVNLGIAFQDAGDHRRALPMLEEALAGLQAVGDRSGAAAARLNLGSLLRSMGDLPRALALCEQALAESEEIGDRGGAAAATAEVGRVLRAQNDLPAAREALERAVRAARSLRAAHVQALALRDLAEVHLAAGDATRALGAAEQALDLVEGFLSGLGDEQGALARQALGPLFAVGILAAARQEDAGAMFTFLESGRAGALLDSLDKHEALRQRAETVPADLRAAEANAGASERAARRAYEQALESGDRRRLADAAKALDDAIERVRAAHAHVQREVKRAPWLFYPRARTLEDMQARLAEDEVLVLYGLCLEEALALVVLPGATRIVALGKRREVETACASLVAGDASSDPSDAMAALRRLLRDPLALGDLPARVLVSPEGPLCLLPWGAILERPACIAPSGTTHLLLRDGIRERGQGVLALGDPDYAGVSEGARAVYWRGRRLAPLPATRPEAQAVGTTTLLGSAASEQGLRTELVRRTRWRAVHFACHGLIDPVRPGLAALALSAAGDEDGFLTAREIGRLQIPADLAVLSACETGSGRLVRSEGILGLTRAFMYAGAPRVLCSLWRVDDAATRALMEEFYRLWNPADGSKGLGAAAALRAAQEHVRAREQWKHPHYWAAWVLWGLGD
jgi:tetratricopeptide (TPR) repeat protein